jgi:glycosyltransferase involved in cell wall biosynthesis
MLLRVGGFTKKQTLFIKRNKLQDRIRQFVNIDEKRLVDLYNLSDVFVMPSYAEGFGLPVLEAMACGCPVVCSDIGVFRELYDDAAAFVNPNDPDNFSDEIRKILEKDSYKDSLIKKGLEKSRKFSWEKCAAETYKVYEEVYDEISK